MGGAAAVKRGNCKDTSPDATTRRRQGRHLYVGDPAGRRGVTGYAERAEPGCRSRRLIAMKREPRARTSVPLLLAPLILTACGSESDLDAAARPEPRPAEHANVVPAGYEGRFRFVGTVLESPEHGPQLCTAVMTSFPPQCGGPDIVGWDWAGLDTESSGGTAWGDYVLIGRWDGTRLTLTERPRVIRDDDRASQPDIDFTSPCAEPAGGWRTVDESKATDTALEQTLRRSESMPGFAGSWVDQSYLDGENDPEAQERSANDPTRLVLNLRFTHDLEARERDVRETWGGALCVSRAERAKSELDRIQQQLSERPGFLSSGQDVVANVVDLGVWAADADLIGDIERRYGRGAVRVIGVLEPVDL